MNDQDVSDGEPNDARLPTSVVVMFDREALRGWHRPQGGAP